MNDVKIYRFTGGCRLGMYPGVLCRISLLLGIDSSQRCRCGYAL